MVATQIQPCPSLRDTWAAALGSGAAGSEQAGSLEAPAAADETALFGFATRLAGLIPEWAGLFSQIPKDNKRRSEALGGAVKLKAAGKRFEKLTGALAAQEDRSSIKNELAECQVVLHESVRGLLDVSFAVDEMVTKSDFEDADALAEATARMQVAMELTEALGGLYAAAGQEIKPPADTQAESLESLPGEMRQMLEKLMAEKKGSSVPSTADATAVKAAWAQADGRRSTVLGEEVWEAVCWRRGIFLFSYVSFLLTEPKIVEVQEAPAAEGTAPSEERACRVSRELFADTMRSFDAMLQAQGPIRSDLDDPSVWRVWAGSEEVDETERMFHHGIYSSTHLKALKHLCELAFWLWKHRDQNKADAEVAAVLNRKFVHIVRHIMPGRGWTADVEYDRVVEMEASFGSSAFSAGLNDKPPEPKAPKAGKDKKSKKDKGGGGGAAGKEAPALCVAGGAAEAAAPAAASQPVAESTAEGGATPAEGAAKGQLAEGAAPAAGEGQGKKKKSSKKK